MPLNKEKIRILRILNRFNIGGPSWNAVLLSKFIGDEFETLLVGGTHYKGEDSSFYLTEKYHVNSIILPYMKRSINPFNDIRTLYYFISLVRKFRPHIIHSHAAKAGFFSRIIKVMKFVNCPTVHTFHGHVFSNYFSSIETSFYKKIESFLANFTNVIIVPSQKLKKEIIEILRIPENKVVVIPLAIDLTNFSRISPGFKKQCKEKLNLNHYWIVGYCGRIIPIKNLTLFIDVIAELKKNNCNIKGLIAGNGEISYVNNIISYAKSKNLIAGFGELKHLSNVDLIITGWAQDMQWFYSLIDIFLITSLSEGTPLSLIEAMACGIPCVATPAGGIPDIIKNGISGFFTFSYSVKEISSAIYSLMDNPYLYLKISNEAKKYVTCVHSTENLISQTRNLYFRLLGKYSLVSQKD